LGKHKGRQFGTIEAEWPLERALRIGDEATEDEYRPILMAKWLRSHLLWI
jgi:hypothetical protein